MGIVVLLLGSLWERDVAHSVQIGAGACVVDRIAETEAF
jgi:hypothetical protein